MGLLSTFGAASGRAYGFTRSAIAAATDAFFNRVTLLLPGNGTNGAQNNTFIDSSTNNFTITRNGNTTQGTFSPFSQTGWGNFFNGSTDYLTVADNAAFTLGTGDFTVEYWAFVPSAADTRAFGQMDASATLSTISIFGGINSSGKAYSGARSGSTEYACTSTGNFPTGQWVHHALVRDGSTLRQYINGVQDGTSAISTASINDSSAVFAIGRLGAYNAYYWNGYISNFRLVKGTCLYPSGTTFTPPTAVLTAITNTSLLTCQSNRFIDNSSNAFAITVNGTPSVQAFSPFAPTAAYSATTNGGSGYFDGSGDYLTVASNSAFTFTGDFTWEGWFYMTANPAQSFSARLIDYNNTGNFLVFSTSDGTDYLGFAVAGTTYTTTTPLPRNQWAHVAVSRSGAGSNNLKLFLNGTAVSTQTNTSTITAAQISISNRPGSDGYFTGYMSSYRLTNTGLYTANFTPPTSPPTSASALLLSFTNAGITDATAKNDLETVGNAQISTTQSKFGGSSMYFDGTGDQLVLPASENFEFGSGNFTVECWVYITGSSGSIINYSNGQAANSNFCWEIYQVTSTSVATTMIEGSTVYQASSSSFTINAWNHIAAVRNGNTLTIYVNGTAGGTTANVTGVSISRRSGVTVKVSGYNNATGMITGYVDDLRITKGLARYTTTFTPPTAAFPLS